MHMHVSTIYLLNKQIMCTVYETLFSTRMFFVDETECQKAPKITVQPESIFTTMGSPVTLECHTSGCPIPKITWFKDNAIVSNDPYLVIQAVTLSDRGFYACKAENNYGYAFSSEAKLSLKGLSYYSNLC